MVYNNSDYMKNGYLDCLLLSQAFWISHSKMMRYFRTEFCVGNKDKGEILEVPSGTGIYISEFININNSWNATAFDISTSSVNFTKRLLNINSTKKVDVIKKNVFEADKTKKYDLIICGELLEHLENPEELLVKLESMLKDDGEIFLTTAIWTANIDHIYLFKSAKEVKKMISIFFDIEKELVLSIVEDKKPIDKRTPMNYAAILIKKR